MLAVLVEIIGWVGAVAVLLAYYMISAGKWSRQDRSYHVVNFVGAVFLIINTLYVKAYPSAFVNVVWLFIALPGIFKTSKE